MEDNGILPYLYRRHVEPAARGKLDGLRNSKDPHQGAVLLSHELNPTTPTFRALIDTHAECPIWSNPGGDPNRFDQSQPRLSGSVVSASGAWPAATTTGPTAPSYTP